MDVSIFTHGDTDGICAGAIARAANSNAQVIFTNPYNLLRDLVVLKGSEAVILCDISLPENNLTQVIERLNEIAKHGDLIYVDHHPLPKTVVKENLPGKIIHNTSLSTSELIYTHFQVKLDPLHTRTVIYGAIADYLDHTHLIQRLLKKWDERTLYFEAGILLQGIVSLKGDFDSKKKILVNLAENMAPSLDEELVRRAILHTRKEWEAVGELKRWIRVEGTVSYTVDFPFSLGKTATYIRGLTDALVGIAGERRNDEINMSLRALNKKIDLNKILRKIAPELGGSGGGHPLAAGARIPEKKFDKFLKVINEELGIIKLVRE